MYYLCDCCSKPIDKGGAYLRTIENTEFCICSLCNMYYNMLINEKDESVALTEECWASLILQYDMVKPLHKALFAKVFCKNNNKKSKNYNF